LLRLLAGNCQNTVPAPGIGSAILKTWKPADARITACAPPAADTAFAHVLAERTAVVPRVPPYWPGEF
jgi:hypothetical protein